jgi:hypothetical protein
MDSMARFTSAARTSPTFAAAHLWYVLSSWAVTSTLRDHYASAVVHRSSLSPLQLAVLEAIQPVTEDPPDRVKAAERLASLVERFPKNPDLLIILATYYERIGDREHGLPFIARAVALPGHPPLAEYIRARLFSLTAAVGAPAEPIARDLEQCVQASLAGTDCLYDLARVDANEGKCGSLESLARTEMARQPDSWLAYSDLANALSSTGRPIGAVRAALEEEWRRVRDPTEREEVRGQDEIDLAISAGRLADAYKLAEAYKLQRARSGDADSAQAAPYKDEVFLAIELGESSLAAKVSRELADVSAAWPTTENSDPLAAALYLGTASGDLTTQERDSLRRKILREAEAPSYGAPYRRWINAYAGAVTTRAEALDAIAQMPTEPIPGPQYRDAEDDYTFGRIFLLADQQNTAKQFFWRAAHSCSLSDDLFRTKARYELARLDEADAKTDACATFLGITRHWESSPGSSTVRGAQARLDSLSCGTVLSLAH